MNTINPVRNLLALVSLLLFLALGITYAQDDSAVAKSDKQQEQKKEDDSSKESKTEVVTPDRIEVTDQFSKDIPADFPVDI